MGTIASILLAELVGIFYTAKLSAERLDVNRPRSELDEMRGILRALCAHWGLELPAPSGRRTKPLRFHRFLGALVSLWLLGVVLILAFDFFLVLQAALAGQTSLKEETLGIDAQVQRGLVQWGAIAGLAALILPPLLSSTRTLARTGAFKLAAKAGVFLAIVAVIATLAIPAVLVFRAGGARALLLLILAIVVIPLAYLAFWAAVLIFGYRRSGPAWDQLAESLGYPIEDED